MPTHQTITRHIQAGMRLNAGQALYLLQKFPLGALMRLAYQARRKKHPDNTVTFVFDTNPNPTNICVTRCSFCAFWRNPKAKDSYTLTPVQLAEKVNNAEQAGATTVLFQGGHNPEVTLADWLAYIRAIRAKAPAIHIHPFSAPEIAYMAEREGLTPRHILQTLWNEGIHTLPGGGAEILVERVREKLSAEKCTVAEWLRIMREAHDIGFKTTATMMYGHVESDAEIIGHLSALRDLQDQSHGFSSFIPWSFKSGNSTLGKKIKQEAHPIKYIRIIAVARLFLDNFEHIQSSWFSESVKAGQLGLLAGADDFGGLLFEENVLGTTGHTPTTNLEQTQHIIRSAGFAPAQRNTDYQIIRR
ncbi:MAG: dehypoxanthine futalosine cyclase [Gammaproteobacteria bacterium HGW-Gammaproteobacteria-3]|nr:MAG: dehypoxanthine futalosine cyclase [Gammaproteobacteria bacterium HGW-Gammaproteobacteria-3]